MVTGVVVGPTGAPVPTQTPGFAWLNANGTLRPSFSTATRLSGEKTYSRAVEKALEDYVRRAKARQILQLQGRGLWQGDLAVMRDDRPTRRRRP